MQSAYHQQKTCESNKSKSDAQKGFIKWSLTNFLSRESEMTVAAASFLVGKNVKIEQRIGREVN